MPSRPLSPIRKAWYQWKTLRLPWRKRFFVGRDLSGNTFWEFRDTLSSTSTRMRRIVQYPAIPDSNRALQYSDISSQITPAWHQWLRHTRADPPSLTEQAQDVARQQNLKVLAAQADARWAAKPSFLDAPTRYGGRGSTAGVGQPVQVTESMGLGEPMEGVSTTAESRPDRGLSNSVDGTDASGDISSPRSERRVSGTNDGTSEGKERLSRKEHDPWKRERGGPSEEWQPKAWDPNAVTAGR